MARSDSLLWFLAGFAQLFVGSSLAADPTLATLGIILELTGGGSVLLGLYMLLFLARYHKEFETSYSKLEKTTMVRNDQGIPHRVDSGSKTVKAVWYVIPVLLTFFAAVGWLANQ